MQSKTARRCCQLFGRSVIAATLIVTAAAGPAKGEDGPAISPLIFNGGTIILDPSKPTIVATDLRVTRDTVLVTNGHAFTIVVMGQMALDGTLTISSYTDDARHVDGPPAKPATAAGGTSYDPGPMTDGAGEITNGHDGGAGAPGVNGTDGAAGKSAGQLVLVVQGDASGTLNIVNSGTGGQAGGPGGAAGAGGSGQQGGRGRPKKILGVIVSCDVGPAYGGSGGTGGVGGTGGTGGTGGNGGDTSVKILGNVRDLKLSVDVRGGAAGERGVGGEGGAAGAFGWGGRGGPGVEGRVEQRHGRPGTHGAVGTTVGPSQAGKSGHFDSNLPDVKPQS